VFWTLAQTGRLTPLVMGQPGCGKSRSVEAFAAAMGRQCYTLIGSIREPTEIGGYPYPVQREDYSYMAVMPPKWAQDCMIGQWVLFFDELTTCPPPVQAALLGVIAENRVGDTTLPDTVWKVAACNPPDSAANGSEIEPALANRMAHLNWETDVEGWQRAMANSMTFNPPSFVPLPQDWEKRIGRNSGMVAAFHKHRPGLLEAYPKERAKASGAWPSIRSWTNGAIAAAAMEAIDAEPLLRYQAITGCVGEEACLEFQNWEQNLDLPDPENWLAHAELSRAAKSKAPINLDIPPRCDQVMAVLSGLVDRVKHYNLDDKGQPTEARWLAATDCFAEVGKIWLESAIAGAADLYFAAPNAECFTKANKEFTLKVLETYRHITAAK
jgi:hypothetical protein